MIIYEDLISSLVSCRNLTCVFVLYVVFYGKTRVVINVYIIRIIKVRKLC